MTEYVVLVKDSDGLWLVTGMHTARSAHAAIRAAVEDTTGGEYVAVPDRSWQPVTVKVETQTRMVLT